MKSLEKHTIFPLKWIVCYWGEAIFSLCGDHLTLERHQLHRIDRVLKKCKNLKVYTRENFVANVPRIRRVEKQKNKIPRKKCY